MRYRFWFSVVAVVLLICVYSFADVPKMINFQGRLTDASGKFVSDGNYSLTFKIYADSTGGSSKWSETQSVAVSKGLFNTILGSQTPIPDSIFNYTNTWLGIQVGADPEMTPRQRLSSLGYAYRGAKADTSNYSKDADKLDGLHASDFSGVGSDYGRSGVATDLYEQTTTLTNKYVNVAGPDSVYSTSGTAFTGRATGGGGPVSGIRGYAENTVGGKSYGVYGFGSNTTIAEAYGVYGSASNNSSGDAFGGYFATNADGTGSHHGVRGAGYSSSSSSTYGLYGTGSNSSTGEAFGVYGWANSSTGKAYGGFFATSSSGAARHYGIRAEGLGNSDSVTYGAYGLATNYSTGEAYGGFFSTSTSGTGDHYGLRAEGYGAGGAASYTYGIDVSGENASSGPVWGGRFIVTGTGTGTHLGISAIAEGSSSTAVTGVSGEAIGTSSGPVYGGTFYAYGGGTGTKYGVRAYASTAEGYAGYFSGNTLTTGTKSAAVEVNNGEYRLLYAMESPENWFEDFGKGALVNGKAVIQIDPLFAQTVNTSVEYHVFPVSEGDCNGLYITSKTSASFEVREMQGGTSNIPFSYRLVAKRKGYENIRLAKMMGQTPEKMQAEQAKRMAESEQERAQMKRGRKERTEEEVQQYRPKPPEEESVQKVRREEPRPEDTEKMRAVSEE